MKKRNGAWQIAVILLAVISLGGCKMEKSTESKEQSLPADGIALLDIRTGPGNLTITGDEHAAAITAKAEFIQQGLGKGPGYIFKLEKDGDIAKLTADTKNGFFIMHNDRINVTITLPASLALRVKDDSGDLLITNVNGGLELTDESGDINLQDVQAISAIHDDSGDIVLTRTSGNMDLHDESGNLTVNDHTGDLKIKDDSGDIRLSGIAGNISVNDESGNITLKRLKETLR